MNRNRGSGTGRPFTAQRCRKSTPDHDAAPHLPAQRHRPSAPDIDTAQRHRAMAPGNGWRAAAALSRVNNPKPLPHCPKSRRIVQRTDALPEEQPLTGR
jgi:hypothetical protein